MDFRCFDFGKRTEIMVSFEAFCFKTLNFFYRIFDGLALGNEKPKGTPDVWMMESNRTNTLWIPSDLGFRLGFKVSF
ncbi:uncharacterized protein OCT59_007265 [Rhizophagus irregularis]|uniref:uncharacterized protein n=1 Tax=Rhizophagus irregularis TaxID=588596 RepID=UPI0033179B1E|nr:hypothetical protein OCT59_007265 [Rhizophagus irregularis]